MTSTKYLGPPRMEKAIGKGFHYLPFFLLNSFFLNWVPVIPSYFISWGFPGGSVVKNLPVSAGDKGSIPRLEDPLKKEVATHTSIFFLTLFHFTILYWFCHTSTWIHHGCTHVPNPEPPSPLPPIPSLWVIPMHQPQASCIIGEQCNNIYQDFKCADL